MDQIPDDTGTQAGGQASPDLKHLQATYRLTCYQTQRSIILGLARVDSKNPSCIEWTFPIQPGYQSALIEILDDGTFKTERPSDGIVNP